MSGEGQFKVITEDFVNVLITNSAQESKIGTEKRFQKGLTILNFKGKLELMTGGNPATMKLELYSKDDKLICELDNNDALLGSYPVEDGMRIHVIDNFLLYNDFETNKVEKYELSEEQYSKKQDTVKSFLLKNKLGKYNEEEMKKRQEQQAKELAEEEKLIRDIVIGSRCMVSIPSAPTRKGTVMYTGKLDGQPGYFVGIKYDEPLGKNDGSLMYHCNEDMICRKDGKRYFECLPKYGGFVKPVYITCGDYPEDEIDLDEEI